MIPIGYLQIRLLVMSDFSKLNEENDTKVTLHEIYYRTCVIFLKTLFYALTLQELRQLSSIIIYLVL